MLQFAVGSARVVGSKFKGMVKRVETFIFKMLRQPLRSVSGIFILALPTKDLVLFCQFVLGIEFADSPQDVQNVRAWQ